MDLHLKGLGPRRDRLADMPEAEQADGLARDLAMDALRRAGPIGPIALPQAPVGIRQRDAARQQGRHHIFRDRLFMAEAVADCGRGWQRVEIDHVVAGARHMEQLEPGGLRQIGIELHADDDLGLGIGPLVAPRFEMVRQQPDIGLVANQLVKAVAEGSGVLAVEDNAHGPIIPSVRSSAAARPRNPAGMDRSPLPSRRTCRPRNRSAHPRQRQPHPPGAPRWRSARRCGGRSRRRG